jgi:hypothetical protein
MRTRGHRRGNANAGDTVAGMRTRGHRREGTSRLPRHECRGFAQYGRRPPSRPPSPRDTGHRAAVPLCRRAAVPLCRRAAVPPCRRAARAPRAPVPPCPPPISDTPSPHGPLSGREGGLSGFTQSLGIHAGAAWTYLRVGVPAFAFPRRCPRVRIPATVSSRPAFPSGRFRHRHRPRGWRCRGRWRGGGGGPRVGAPGNRGGGTEDTPLYPLAFSRRLGRARSGFCP